MSVSTSSGFIAHGLISSYTGGRSCNGVFDSAK